MNKFEKQNILKFISSLGQKNYSEANKYLGAVVESKLRTRISNAAKNSNPFN